MRARAIQIMSELADAYTAVPPRHKEYIMSHMDEIADLQQIKCGNISVVKWIRDCFRTSAFAKWDMADIKCTMAYYMPLIKRTTRKFFGKGR